MDIWTKIQACKPTPISNPVPYVPPGSFLRRPLSSLSTKSLELCTESLGSETGSDCAATLERSPPTPPFFFSPPPLSPDSPFCLSPYSSSEESSEREYMSHMKEAKGAVSIPNKGKSVNYNCATSRKSPARSFPPPLPSISRVDGPCLHVKRHSEDGRLVLQAVEVPSHSYLHAQREGGRLRLSFASLPRRLKDLNNDEGNHAQSEVERRKMNLSDHVEEDEEEEEEEEEEHFKDDDSRDAELEHDDFSDGDNDEFVVPEEEEEIGLKVLKATVHSSVAMVVKVEEWRRSTVPAAVELHRSLGKTISQPVMNMNPRVWPSPASSEKVSATVELGNSSNVNGGGILAENDAGAEQTFNEYKCRWRGGGGGGGLDEGPKAVSSDLVSQDPVKEVANGFAHTRCSDPHRSHHLLILERYCVATT